MPGTTGPRNRRRKRARTGLASLAAAVVVFFAIAALPNPSVAQTIVILLLFALTATALICLTAAVIDTVRLRRSAPAELAADQSGTVLPGTPMTARRFLSRVLRVLQAIRMVLMLIFVLFTVVSQANAIAYLAGKRGPDVSGSSAPIPITSIGVAIAVIIGGLVFEAIVVVIFLIAGAIIRQRYRDRHPQRHASR
jgi:hypothetical protein